MILRSAGVEPVVHPADVDEDAIIARLAETKPEAPAERVVLELARAKSAAVAAQYPDDVVIACDSMLHLDGELQGKPHTVEATIGRWRAQRGKTADLVTGHCIRFGSQEFADTGRTLVRFGSPTDGDIEAYARTGEPLECAGAFTLESLGAWFVDAIEGDPSNVIGLSLPLVRRALYEFGLSVADFW